MVYNLSDDLATFFKGLAKPAGSTLRNRKMKDVGDSLTKSHNGKDETLATYFVDMEGGYHRSEEFNAEQLSVLYDLLEKGKKYPFVCYPDIPADIMKVLFYYADTHNNALNRLPLWKLARTNIHDRKVMWVLCYLLDCGVVVPDHIEITKTDIENWSKMYDQFFTGKKIETEFRVENLSPPAAEAVNAEAARISALQLS